MFRFMSSNPPSDKKSTGALDVQGQTGSTNLLIATKCNSAFV